MSSYDPPPTRRHHGRYHSAEGLITQEQFKESMRLVRMQIAIPISVLIAMGSNLICALALKPGLAGINALYPTLVSPNSIMVGLYWAVLYLLQVGFCLVLLLVRKEITKETLVYGVGLRFALANWIQAAWAVAFTLQIFPLAEVLILVNVLNLLTVHLTLLRYPPTLTRPIDTVFIHAPMALLLAILFELDWIHNGFIALNWLIKEDETRDKYVWQAVGILMGVNFVAAVWEGVKRYFLLSIASIYLILTIMFASPRSRPTLPTTALPKPTPLLIALIACLVLHVAMLVVGTVWHKSSNPEGRVRLEEDREEEEEAEREAHPAERH